MNEAAVLTFSLLMLIAFACQWLAWRLKLPSILFLLLAGIVLGPVVHWLQPDELLGNLLFPFISLSISIILFEGSLSLKWYQIRCHGRAVFNLVTVGVVITTVLTALAAHYLLALSWQMAALFGSITAVSGPTVIVPMLRAVKPTPSVANILRWEGILIDPIGALLAILIFIGIVALHTNAEWTMVVWHFCLTLVLGLGIGLCAGLLLAYLLRRQWVPDYLQNLTTLSVVMVAFAGADHVAPGAGLFAVTSMGILLTNLPKVHIEEVVGFKENLSLILISTVFIVLAARVNFHHIEDVFGGMIILLVIMQCVIRPVVVFLSTWRNSRLRWQEKCVIAWIAPRGIIAASVAAIFSIQLTEHHIVSAEMSRLLVLLTFIVIIGTVVFQSLTSRPLAHWLKVSEGEARGVLLVGASRFSIALGRALQQLDYPVLLTTTHWHRNRLARMEGLECYYGNPVSEHDDRYLDLFGMGTLLAISSQHDLNTLACLKYQRELGRRHVFIVSTGDVDMPRSQYSQHRAMSQLFAAQFTYVHLNELVKAGWQVKTTQLTANFRYADYQSAHPEHVPLVAIDLRGQLWWFTQDTHPEPAAGWKLVSLMQS